MREPPSAIGQYRVVSLGSLRGWVDASSPAGTLLDDAIDPRDLCSPEDGSAAPERRNRVVRLDFGEQRVWIKCFEPRGRLSFLRYLGRQTKAEKAWAFAFALLARDIGTPRPLAGLAGTGPVSRLNAVLVYEDFPDATDLGAALCARRGAARAALLASVGRFLARFHDVGFRHRDLQGSNLLVREARDGFELSLVDINRTRYHPRLAMRQRLRDLERLPLEVVDLADFFAAYAPPGARPEVLVKRHARRLYTRARLQKLPWPLNRVARRVWYYWREVSTFSPSRPI